MQYFPNLKQGDPINRKWFNDLIGFCNSLVLRGDGRTTRVNRTASGTTVSAIPQPVTAGGGGGAHAAAGGLPFTITGGTAANVVEISGGFASRNGASVYVSAGTATVSQSGYLMLRAPWDDSNGGWQPFEYAVIPITGGTSVAITDADFPLGYVTVSGGTAFEAATSFHPAMAVFIKTGTC